MINVSHQPRDPGPAAWNEILPNHAGFGTLKENIKADVVIIGAGFAGLSAARRIQQLDPKTRVVLLEARRVAEGPAGRNSGFMIDLPHNLGSKNYTGSTSKDQQQTEVNRAAIAFARDCAAEQGMPDEAFAESGKINAAATEKGHKHNIEYARHLETIGEAGSLLDASQMREICGSEYYRGGLFTPGTAVLQPALYIRCLADGIVKNGAPIYENSAVHKMNRVGAGWHITTPQGKVNCGKVIIATNGHVESFGFFKRRLMHIYLYASMTAPLDDTQIQKLGGQERWAFTPADPMGTTVRKINGAGGRRIVVRNRFTWSPDRQVSDNKLIAMSKAHDRSFAARFPSLKACPMEYRWGGLLCLSLNNAPAFGELETGLFSACCQNGLGTAMGTASGMAIGEKLLGVSTPLTEYFDYCPVPAKLPPEPFATLGANSVMRWREARAGKEL